MENIMLLEKEKVYQGNLIFFKIP